MSNSQILDLFINKIEESEIKDKFVNNLQRTEKPSEKLVQIVSFLMKLGLSNNQLTEFLKGAHFTISDNGQLYNQLKDQGYERISSHYPNEKPQADIGIKVDYVLEQFLIGTTGEKTWFQIESSAMPEIKDIFNDYEAFNSFVSHSVDFMMYVGSGKTINIGQYGTSYFTEYKPILLEAGQDSLLSDINLL